MSMRSLALLQRRTFWELVPEQEAEAARGRALSDSLLVVSSHQKRGDADASTVYSDSNASSEVESSEELGQSDAASPISEFDESSDSENAQECHAVDASSFEVGPPPGTWTAKPRRITVSRKGTFRLAGQRQRTANGLREARPTTLVIRDLPKEFNRSHLLQFLKLEGCMGAFDFAYVPYNFKKSVAFGYALVNFITPAFAEAFVHHVASRNVGLRCEWSQSLQGLTALLQRYEHSPVMKVSEEHRPLFLHV